MPPSGTTGTGESDPSGASGSLSPVPVVPLTYNFTTYMKTAFGILKRDLLALLKNPIALLVVGALMVLPGLYAWYCIVANWDPYANTGSMPVAIVNHDKGAENNLAGEVNVGEQVIAQLHDNDSIDWRFYDDEDEALYATRTGEVYATIVFPEDLSENLVGIFTGSDAPPTICYYPNEKYNAVATKVTDSAAQTLVRQINQNFSSTVNEKILSSTQGIADDVEARADKTNQSAIAEIKAVQEDIDKVIASLDDAASSIAGWRDAAAGANAALAGTSEQLPAIASALAQGSGQLNSLRAQTSDFESRLSKTILDSAATVSNLAGQSSATLVQATKDLRETEMKLEALSDAAASVPELEAVVTLIDVAVNLAASAVEGASDRVSEIGGNVQAMSQDVTSATNRISNEIVPQLNGGAVSLSTSFSKLSGAVEQFEPQVATLMGVLSETDGALETATGAIADAKTLLSTIGANLKGTVTDIGAIGSALEVDRLSDLLNVDPENVGTFISSPVHMVTEKINPVSNYGTAVAPFYTNLALWIGCFILVSLMKVEVNAEGFEGATTRQRYFGRWLLFIILSLVQSQVICGVDILLGIDCENPALFMLAGAVCSFTYMNLIYALVKTFRNIGKTLCILLLIMQVPGSSGMYPIQMMPSFFQTIHPLLPFTYGIDAMREALSGVYGLSYLRDVAFLLIVIVAIAFVIGLALRPFMANALTMFDDEMNQAGFFASEEHAQRETDRLRGMFRMITSHDSYADDFEERAWRFNRTYPKWRRAGVIAMFAIPFGLLVLLFPFNLTVGLSIDVKLGALVIMVVLLLAVALALTVLEYTHRTIAEETRLLGLQIMSDFGDEGDYLDLVSMMLDDGESASAAPIVPAQVAGTKSGPTRDIFATDMRLGFQSVVGVVVIMLLVITPSMYAWFNISGSWDPYSSTGNLQVAVANEDEGYKGELIPVTINIGDTVVSQLRGNTSFDWVFVSKDEAIEGVKSSEYYAAIEIPGDFSRNMMTYLVDDADYPDVVYYTNEKENPIAPIITQKGADAIQENIRVSFTERVDEIALSVAYDVLDYVTNPRMSNYVSTMGKHLDDATRDTKSASREIMSIAGLCRTIAGIVDTTGTAIDGLKGASASAKDAVGDAKAGLADASSAFDGAISVVQQMLDGRSVDIGKIQGIIDAALELLEAGADGVPDLIDDVIAQVEELQADNPGVAEAEFKAVLDKLQDAKAHAAAVPGDVAQARADTDALIANASAELQDAKSYFNNTVVPSIDELRGSMESISSSTSSIVSGLEGALDGLGDSTGGLSNQLAALSGGLSKAADKLESSAANIDATKKRVAEALKSGDLRQIEDVILGGDPEVLAASLAAPVQLQREAMYPVSNYGSAMAPFYTVLSLWVGALVMISTMRVHVVEERIEELRKRYGRVRPRHEFFGRYGIFGFIGLMQGALVLLGDLMLLHIQCVHPILFLLFGLFIGQIFCLIVYTITELFGDVGKALCVILLIMQVAASGGTFPAEMLDPLLFNIVPFLPFYHAMTLLQECVAGVFWPAAIIAVVALVAMAGAMLVIGLPLRRPFRKLNDFFEEQLEKTGYM